MRIMAAVLACLLTTACATTEPAEEAPPVVAAEPVTCGAREFNVYFESWQATLSDAGRRELAAVQDMLAGCRIGAVRIVGMAGAPGDEDENQLISQQRASAVASALAEGGWNRESFVITAIGEAGATTAEGEDRPMRRRVRVSVQSFAP